MRSFNSSVILFLFACICGRVSAATACQPEGSPEATGFDAVFRSYPLEDLTSVRNSSFMSSGYKSHNIVATAKDVTDPNFSGSAPLGVVETGTIYGQTVDVTNFTLELTGYFKAPSTGTYTFTASVDNSLVAFFGDGFACCDKTTPQGSDSPFLFSTGYTNKSTSVDLEGGGFYPMRVVFGQNYGPYQLKFDIVTPDGTVIADDWSSYIYQFSDDVQCVTTVISTTIPWTGTITETTTSYKGSTAIIEVETPYSIERTSPWTGSSSVTTLIPNPSGSGSILELLTPYSTITSLWTGASTVTTLIPNPSGTGSIIELLTPYSTITSLWTGSSTVTTLVLNPSGSGSVVEVLTPAGQSIQTTAPWTGSSTITTLIPNPSGSGSILELLTPYSTITSLWTGASTVTTLIPNPSGTGSIIELLTPYSIQTTAPWTGSSSVTTLVPNPSGTGSILELLTPYSIQTTAPWTGSSSVTTLVPNPSGTGYILELLTPAKSQTPVTVTVYEPCDKGSETSYTSSCDGTVAVVVKNPTITATSTVGCDTVTIYKPCHKCEAATYTTSAGGSIAVIIENPTITATSTYTVGSNSSGSEASLSKGDLSPVSTTVAGIYEGAASSLVYLSSSMIYPILLLLFLF